jgi:hypothetical protein
MYAHLQLQPERASEGIPLTPDCAAWCLAWTHEDASAFQALQDFRSADEVHRSRLPMEAYFIKQAVCGSLHYEEKLAHF